MASSTMTLLPPILFLLFLLSQTHSFPLPHGRKRSTTTPSKLVRSSCSHARYPNICLRTLSSLSPPPNSLPALAQAAVSLTLSRARKTTTFVSSILPAAHGKRNRAALRDCAEQLSDSIDDLRRTLSELRHLRSATFRWQMSNAQTWVSAALTNEDTCLDGFQGVPGGAKAALKRKIRNIARVTSNALYLINRVADTRRTAP
ncbi:hypothetical protein ACLOJK_025814 [Asimina triloba]